MSLKHRLIVGYKLYPFSRDLNCLQTAVLRRYHLQVHRLAVKLLNNIDTSKLLTYMSYDIVAV